MVERYEYATTRPTAALPTQPLAARFPPASVTEELAQFPKQSRVRWEDVKPALCVILTLAFLYIGMHAASPVLCALGYGFAAGVLALGLMPRKRAPVYTNVYLWRFFGQTFLVYGEDDDAWFAKGKRR